MKSLFTAGVVLVAALFAAQVNAALPAPSDEAKAKAAEGAAKSAHAGKVGAYQLCKVQDKVAADYFAATKQAGKAPHAPEATPPCVDPGAFVYTPGK